jgi:hypothetical protein
MYCAGRWSSQGKSKPTARRIAPVHADHEDSLCSYRAFGMTYSFGEGGIAVYSDE